MKWTVALIAVAWMGCYDYRHVATRDAAADVAADAPEVAAEPCGGACSPGRTCCAGACVDLAASAAHCGACGGACPTVAHASAGCALGRCTFRCEAGRGDCDGVATNGCEVDLAASPAHCGACGAACPAREHAAPTCAAGACGLACEPGWGDCNGAAADGCELATSADVAHCGACGRACPARAHATTRCAAGACAHACDARYGDCDGVADNGCEVDLQLQAQHCGACGNACARGSRCVGARCVPVVELAGGIFTMGENELDPDAGGPASDVVDASAPDGAAGGGGGDGGAGDGGAGDGGDGAGTGLVVDPRDGAPRQPNVTISTFVIDRDEVSVARFRRYWADGHPGVGGAALLSYPGSHVVPWRRSPSEACAVVEPRPVEAVEKMPEPGFRPEECNWSAAEGARESHPINCVDWCTAQAYCAWAGGRLPTEAEWEYAARGVERRPYPWGDALPSDQLCWFDDHGAARTGTCAVGSFPSGATPSGVLDLLGNVSEWTADTYATYLDLRGGMPMVTVQCWGTVAGRFNPVCTAPDTPVERIAPAYFPEQRAVRGSAWNHDDLVSTIHNAARVERGVDVRRSFIGFRCAWSQ